jgi:hypothetical protein
MKDTKLDSNLNAEKEATRKKLNEGIIGLAGAKNKVDAGKYQEGLEDYVSWLNGNVGYASNFILRNALTDLLQKYPEARVRLESKRDELETLLVNGPQNCRAFEEEWMEVNLSLGDLYREAGLIKQLTSEDSQRHQRTIYNILQINFGKYLRDKRYEVIEPHFPLIGRMYLGLNTMFQSNKLFPKPLYDEHNPDFQRERKRIITEGLHLYELCLVLNHKDAAKNIAQKVLFASCSPDSFYRLLIAANRVEDKQAYDELMTEATDRLPYTEMQKLKDGLKALN